MIICDLNLYRFMIFQMLSTTGSKIDLFHTFIQNLNLNYMCMHMYVHVIYIVSKNPVINFFSRLILINFNRTLIFFSTFGELQFYIITINKVNKMSDFNIIINRH